MMTRITRMSHPTSLMFEGLLVMTKIINDFVGSAIGYIGILVFRGMQRNKNFTFANICGFE
jgi:hypothetical protein